MSVRFAIDILPLFRPGDMDCMQRRGVRLGDAQWICDPAPNGGVPDHGNARRVFDALSSGNMPPDQPWDAARIALFKQWIDDGFNA